MTRPARIAILTHSTNPRGGVVHALSLAEALCDLGHEAVVHAPDPAQGGFFRTTRCETVSVAAAPVAGGTLDLVETRIMDFLAHFSVPANRRFDVFHAQDGIGANALLTMRECGQIGNFARTVHHIDDFPQKRLAQWQRRGVTGASRVFCVSRLWRETLRRDYGIAAHVVGNGVDTAEFRPTPGAADAALRARLGLGPGPLFLSVGGFEERKNTRRVVDAFADVRRDNPSAQWIVAGGASLLDHAAYAGECRAALAAAELSEQAVIVTGPVAQAEMAALHRIADALVFPSVREGFGLVVLEAMASGTPTIVSRIAPFTEFLSDGDTLWADPQDPDSIAAAMRAVLRDTIRAPLIAAGRRVAAAHSWKNCAGAHLDAYGALQTEKALAHA